MTETTTNQSLASDVFFRPYRHWRRRIGMFEIGDLYSCDATLERYWGEALCQEDRQVERTSSRRWKSVVVGLTS